MKYISGWRFAAASVFAATILAVSLLALRPAAAQNDPGKKFCVGCSADGKTTPRTSDGHPDLSGMWQTGFLSTASPAPTDGSVPAELKQFGTAFQKLPDGSILFDFGTEYNAQDGLGRVCQSDTCQTPNQPKYNDKYMPKVREIAKSEFGGTTALDPIQYCRASGVPRAGAPDYILQSKDVIAFLYNEAPYSTFRIVYMGGRQHPDMKTYETTYFGDSIGRWDGDTLVVDTIGFNDDTWLGGGGPIGTEQYTSIHSEKEHVIERLKRDGDVLSYDVTVEDPEALTEPWVLATRKIHHAGPGLEVPDVDAPTENICTPTGDHIVRPNPEDKDIKNRCGYRCDTGAGGAKKDY